MITPTSCPRTGRCVCGRRGRGSRAARSGGGSRSPRPPSRASPSTPVSCAETSSSAAFSPLIPDSRIREMIVAATPARVRIPTRTLQRDSQARTSCLRRFNSGCPLARVRTLQRMDELTTRAPTVPLEAGAGPDNPPCPACGEPLFGWLADQERLGAPVRRCESCGLGVVGTSAGSEEALAVARPARRPGAGADRQPGEPRLLARRRRLGRASNPASTTSSRSRRCADSSHSATRSCAAAAGRPGRASP